MSITAFCSHNLQLEWKEADQFPTDLKLKVSDKENQMNSGNTQSWLLTAVILRDSSPTALQHYFDWEFLASMILPFLVTFPAPETWPVMWRSHWVRQWQAQAPIVLLLLRWTHFGSLNLFGYGSRNKRIDLNEEKTEIHRLPVAKGQGKLFIEPSEQTPAWLFESRWGDTSEDSRAKGACSSDWAC